ncbi:hypothetical protein CYMTET_10754 [Cymbomonas tetramitiformis]|uniref:Metallo-beta-lactamase domain-containing protein n=1 Tax=Cymbomonas tetramitiformis TaxID=36881 RepID=A0AAE0LDI5_9CHLO|nr:hypothetical protein CYMTET_10754 [Cymbomonas tetramitiformis]
MGGITMQPPVEPDHYVEDGQTLEVGELHFEVITTPGHSPGHICFYERRHGILFGGDLIIGGSIGRTDLEGADSVLMVASLQRISDLPGNTVLYSGHSAPTKLSIQLQKNNALRAALGTRFQQEL